jgi:hypothetical protein
LLSITLSKEITLLGIIKAQKQEYSGLSVYSSLVNFDNVFGGLSNETLSKVYIQQTNLAE